MFALLPRVTAEAAGILLPITPLTNDPGCSYQEGSVSARRHPAASTSFSDRWGPFSFLRLLGLGKEDGGVMAQSFPLKELPKKYILKD